MIYPLVEIGTLTNIRTGKLDANASSFDGKYPFFTCSRQTLLSIVLPSSSSRSQSNIAATLAFSLSANEIFWKHGRDHEVC